MTLGAFVRASESGLGCPDWPACHGKLVAAGGHALTEEAHRWVATVLVIGVLGLALALLREHRRDPWVARPMLWAMALLALQVVLGAITVVLKNVSWTVVIHYGGAALLVASLALLTVRLAVSDRSGRSPRRDSFSTAIDRFVALSFCLLLTGSTVANTDSHAACGHGFPLCNGTLFPALDHRVVINLLHRTWAGAMLVLALWLLWRGRRKRAGVQAIQVAMLATTSLYLVQAAIGIVVLQVGENTAIDVVHSSIASLTWTALALLLALNRTLPVPAPVSDATAPRPTTDYRSRGSAHADLQR